MKELQPLTLFMIDSRICKSQTTICQSASQMIMLSCNFPLLIGDKVPECDVIWDSFLLLLKICCIALSPVCTPDTIPYLKILIEEKLSSFKGLYPEIRLIPKFNYMIHYASHIEKFGPLINSWTMRQELKLSFIKRVSRQGNFKNVPLTVAKKISSGSGTRCRWRVPTFIPHVKLVPRQNQVYWSAKMNMSSKKFADYFLPQI